MLLCPDLHTDFMAVDVDFKGVHPQYAGAGGIAMIERAPQYRLGPGDDFGRVERFDDVVVGTDAQAHEFVHVLVLGSQHDHGGGASVPDLGQYHPAVQVRHQHVQQHQVRLERLMHFKGAAAIQGMGALEATALEIGAQDVGDFGFVFGDQYQRLAFVREVRGCRYSV